MSIHQPNFQSSKPNFFFVRSDTYNIAIGPLETFKTKAPNDYDEINQRKSFLNKISDESEHDCTQSGRNTH
jgi:hypothetical protein